MQAISFLFFGSLPVPNQEIMILQDNKTEKVYIMMEARTKELFKKEEDFTVLAKMKGKALEGKGYQPLFPYFKQMKETGAFRNALYCLIVLFS